MRESERLRWGSSHLVGGRDGVQVEVPDRDEGPVEADQAIGAAL